MTQVDRRALLKKLIESGLQVSPDALDFILSLESPMLVVEALVGRHRTSTRPSVLSREYIAEWLFEENTGQRAKSIAAENHAITDTPDIESESFQGETDSTIRVLKNPTYDSVGSAGTVDDFLALFTDRYSRIKRIFAGRIDTQGALSPTVARTRRNDARRLSAMDREGQPRRRPPSLKVLGIVKDKSVSASGNMIIEIEDVEGSIVAVVPTGIEGLRGQQLSEKASSVVLDEIICISGFVDQNGRMIADDVIFPDVPMAREAGRARREVYAVFISDIHCGSNEFLEDAFDRFIDWVCGRDLDSSEKRMVKQIRYLLIGGDLVDGIGVYPTQRNDLSIPNIHEQYALVAEKLRKIPDEIKILSIPGNHDACRQALPRPPILQEFAAPLYNLGDRLMMFGDPCQLVIEGVNIIMTHGDSLDDLVTNIPRASYREPAIPMKSLLQKRHLAPLFGGKTELAPLHRDWMVIDTPPDIIHFGHAHHNAVDVHRGVQIINSGTFQAQTDFMRKQGIVPTPGIVTLVNLRTGAPELKFFYDLSSES